jgi:hypothetical protein
MPEPTKLCLCGKPLHYTDLKLKEFVEKQVELMGECTKVTVGGRTWLVPRHYIALHGLKAEDLPYLGLEEVTTPSGRSK